jgi:hypothetical protein
MAERIAFYLTVTIIGLAAEAFMPGVGYVFAGAAMCTH